MGVKLFNGTKSYTKARDWLTDYKRIARELGWEDAIRRRVVAWNLKGEALEWWIFVGGEYLEQAITWNNFKDRLRLDSCRL